MLMSTFRLGHGRRPMNYGCRGTFYIFHKGNDFYVAAFLSVSFPLAVECVECVSWQIVFRFLAHRVLLVQRAAVWNSNENLSVNYPEINKKCLLCKDAKANRFITGQPHSLVQCIIRCFSQGSPLRVSPCVIMQLSPLLNGGPFAQTHSPSLQALSEVYTSSVSLSFFLFFFCLYFWFKSKHLLYSHLANMICSSHNVKVCLTSS